MLSDELLNKLRVVLNLPDKTTALASVEVFKICGHYNSSLLWHHKVWEGLVNRIVHRTEVIRLDFIYDRLLGRVRQAASTVDS